MVYNCEVFVEKPEQIAMDWQLLQDQKPEPCRFDYADYAHLDKVIEDYKPEGLALAREILTTAAAIPSGLFYPTKATVDELIATWCRLSAIHVLAPHPHFRPSYHRDRELLLLLTKQRIGLARRRFIEGVGVYLPRTPTLESLRRAQQHRQWRIEYAKRKSGPNLRLVSS